MKIKRFEVFEKFTQDEADELKSLFYSIIDTVGDTYQVRSDDKILDDRHQKILRYDTEITKSGNFIIYKKVPVYKTDRTSIISDPVVRISVIVKN
jgi:hypothetical protein